MKIAQVSVCYGELRSTGYPSYSNKRNEVTLTAQLTEGETARNVKNRLAELARTEVQRLFGDAVEACDEMGVPF